MAMSTSSSSSTSRRSIQALIVEHFPSLADDPDTIEYLANALSDLTSKADIADLFEVYLEQEEGMDASRREEVLADLMGSLERARTESSSGGQAAEEKAPIVLAKAAAEWDTGGIMGVGHGGGDGEQNVYRTVQMEELKAGSRKKCRNAEQEEPMVPPNGAAGGRSAKETLSLYQQQVQSNIDEQQRLRLTKKQRTVKQRSYFTTTIVVKDLNLTTPDGRLLVTGNLTINKFRRYGVCGPNGSGKSTLLNMIFHKSLFGFPNVPVMMVSQEVLFEGEELEKPVWRVYRDVLEKERRDLEVEARQLERQLEERGGGGGQRRQEEHVAGEDHVAGDEEGEDEADLPEAVVWSRRLGEIYAALETWDLELAPRFAPAHAETDSSEAAMLAFAVDDYFLKGLGWTEGFLRKRVKDLSGGWRMRLALAMTLAKLDQQNPTNRSAITKQRRANKGPSEKSPKDSEQKRTNSSHLLLLDEPTNHLDLEALLWLEQHLVDTPLTLLVVSHDTFFLDAVCTDIIEVAPEQRLVYHNSCSYSTFREKKRQQQVAARREEAKGSKANEYIKRNREKENKEEDFHTGGYTGSVQSRFDELNFQFPEVEPCGGVAPDHPLVTLQGFSFGFGQSLSDAASVKNKYLLKNLDLQITQSARLAIVGRNGAGKSTLLKIILGLFSEDSTAPPPRIKGTLTRHPKLRLGYVAQDEVDALQHHLHARCLDYVREELAQGEVNHGLQEDYEIRSFLQRYGISKHATTQKLGTFSGGQRTRLLLALTMLSNPHLLILDEPTNHLDTESMEALAIALHCFEGGVVVVSHNREFCQSFCRELWVVRLFFGRAFAELLWVVRPRWGEGVGMLFNCYNSCTC